MKRLLRTGLFVLGGLVGFVLLAALVILPILTAPRGELSPLAKDWRARGTYMLWESTLEENAGFGALDVFIIQEGDPGNPAILFIHGYPTSSFDFHELFELLRDDYYLVAIDTPGYGLSAKPRNGFVYDIEDDARLVEHYVRDLLRLDSFALVTHDKGNSVGLALLGRHQRAG
jgi:pimeloyl-ACP methyl ester carboxylesterase